MLSPFIRETCRWFRFIWTSTTLFTWNMMIEKTRNLSYHLLLKRLFHEVRKTVFVCPLQPYSDSKCKNLTRLFLRYNTIWQEKKILFFYVHIPWNMIVLSLEKRVHDFNYFEQAQHCLRQTYWFKLHEA